MLHSRKSCQWILLGAVAMLPILITLVARLETNTDDIHNWLPKNTAQSDAYQEFTDLFNHDDELLISWPDCRVDDQRLHEFVYRLKHSDRSKQLFSSIASGKTILDELADKKYSYPEKTLKSRLNGHLFDRETGTTAVIVQLTACGSSHGHDCINEINCQANTIPNLSAVDLKIAGNAFTTVQIDNATNNSLYYGLPAVLLATLTTFLCLRSIRLTFACLASAGLAALQSVAIVAMLGFKFNGLLVMMPLLILVLTLSATVHLSSYYLQAVRERHIDPISKMMSVGFRPCLLAIVTTTVGIAMLGVSHVQAVSHFGYFSAIGLSASLTCVALLFPAILRAWPIAKSDRRRLEYDSQILKRPALVAGSRVNSLANGIIACCILAIPIFAIGIGRVDSTLQPEKMFSSKNVVSENSLWLNPKFAILQNVEVVVTFDNGPRDINFVEQIRQLRVLQTGLANLTGIRSTFSIVNVCRIPSGPVSASRLLQNTLLNEALTSEIQTLIDRRLLAVGIESVSWRLRLQIEPESESETGALMHQIEDQCAAITADLPSHPTTIASGLWPLLALGRFQIFSDLANSFVLAFLIITPLIMIVMRGIVVGLLVMIPNVFPALVFFGSLGWLGIEIDTGTVLTACVGLGIAVDDTLHFLNEYNRSHRQGRVDRATSVFAALSTCLRPMVYTTLICSVGLSVFIFSDFLPAQNFAIAIALLLVIALMCDLFVLPALILGPLGHFFEDNSPHPVDQHIPPKPDIGSDFRPVHKSSSAA